MKLKELLNVEIELVVKTFEELTNNTEIIILHNDNTIEAGVNQDGVEHTETFETLDRYCEEMWVTPSKFESEFVYDNKLTTKLQETDPTIQAIYLAYL